MKKKVKEVKGQAVEPGLKKKRKVEVSKVAKPKK